VRRKFALLAVAAILCLGLAPGTALASEPYRAGAAGIGDPYFPDDGNGGYDVQSYLIDVRYDPSTDRLVGVATIKAKATRNLKSFNLDFDGLTLRSATVNGETAKTKRAGGELTVTPKHHLRDDSRFTAVFRYDGVPETLEDFGLSGFIHTEDGAIVIGEPHVASTWFPANDHPSDKARFKFRIKVPRGLQAISNGVLTSHTTSGRWTTWSWDASQKPMTTYLAFMAVGHFDVHAYQADGLRYWDAIDSALMQDRLPAIAPVTGSQFLYSQIGEPAYKQLKRTIAVPPGGATLTMKVDRDTEDFFDFLFVEAHTVGADDWTTLADANGHTNQDPGACPFIIDVHPFLAHYLTAVVVDPGDPSTPDDDIVECRPTGTSGAWNAISGQGSGGWETWSVTLANATASTRQVEVAISYASDYSVQGRGVAIDDIVVSTGDGSTSFEADGNVLDGWTNPIVGPDGDNPNTWTTATTVAAVPGIGPDIVASFALQPGILAFESATFGRYPFNAAGGVVDAVPVGFALENQTRPTYSPFFFGGGPNDFVLVHELAHQWFGDSLAVRRWQHIWLNEGFATYAEWLWSEHQGFDTAQQIFESFTMIPKDDEFWQLPIGDPGPVQLFDFPVYGRGAMTLQALRNEVGDTTFFRILQEWARRHANGTVTTSQFINLAERLSGKDLDDLFDTWLSAGKPAGLPEPPPEEPVSSQRQAAAVSANAAIARKLKDLPPAVRSLAERLKDRQGNPFTH
jgi:hypothetical protein